MRLWRWREKKKMIELPYIQREKKEDVMRLWDRQRERENERILINKEIKIQIQ